MLQSFASCSRHLQRAMAGEVADSIFMEREIAKLPDAARISLGGTR
jgi:hypothetical protein